MRIISGKYKGKKLVGFNTVGTRPTMDRVKESLFGMIQAYISGSVVLDLFAGSGALGLEAISNGAKTCFLIDNNIEAIKMIRENSQNFTEDLKIINSEKSLSFKKLQIIKEIEERKYIKEKDIKLSINPIRKLYNTHKFKELSYNLNEVLQTHEERGYNNLEIKLEKERSISL